MTLGRPTKPQISRAAGRGSRSCAVSPASPSQSPGRVVVSPGGADFEGRGKQSPGRQRQRGRRATTVGAVWQQVGGGDAGCDGGRQGGRVVEEEEAECDELEKFAASTCVRPVRLV